MTDKRNRVLKVIENGVVTQRQCNICKEVKDLSEFGKDPCGFMQRRANCKPCYNDKVRDYNRKNYNPEKNRSSKILSAYGVTMSQVIKSLADQQGLCANRGCGKEISLEVNPTAQNRAVIDHNHETGKFRALLCSSCNLHLGRIEKDRNQTLGLLDYLSKHSV